MPSTVVLPWLFLPPLLSPPFFLPRGMQGRAIGSVAWHLGRASRLPGGARRARAWRPPPPFLSLRVKHGATCSQAHISLLLCQLPSALLFFLFFKQTKMSFAMTANFFYAVVVAGLAYNVFILYAGASAAKLALSK